MDIKLKLDSRRIVPGDTFVAVKGAVMDGHDHIESAIKKGATKIICNHGNYSVETIVVDDVIEYSAKILKEEYSYLFDEMKLIGITGTNGKTTTAMLLHDALNNNGIKTAYIGTVGFHIKNKIRNLRNTTPDIIELYNLFLEAYEAGCKYVVMEVSSHGLENKRVLNLMYDYAVFTNLTRDHLDFHKTMDNYAAAKQKLFKMVNDGGKCIINIDDEYSSNYLLESNINITYGINNGDVYASDLTMNNLGSRFNLHLFGEEIIIDTPLIGEYNIYNLLVVITLLKELNFGINSIKKIVKVLNAPAGRMDKIIYNNNSIIIDYAHTPDAFTKIINTVKEINNGNLYIVFGCTGTRDKEKRPIMTNIALTNSVHSIITVDDPHEENISDIIHDMTFNIDYNNYEVIIDRKEAIKKGIDLLKGNDILLILGKGHEDYIVYKDYKVEHNDANEVKEYLEKKGTKVTT